jgi:hypothetical protein
MKEEMLLRRGLLFASVFLLSALLLQQGAQAFDLSAFRDLVSAGNDTPEKIIAALPNDFRGNASFVYQSRSIQASSPSHPRAILWDEQTGFVMGFNGDSSLKGYQSIEMEGIDRESGQIHFYNVDFPLRRDREGRAALKIEEPKVCLACHGQSARPIWQSFPNWMGAYGGFNDLIQDDEVSDFESFREESSQDPRYRSLKIPQLASELEQQGTPIGLENRPNMRLGALLSRMNALRIRKLLETDDSSKRREILSVFSGCSSQEQILQLLSSLGLSMADLNISFDHEDPANDQLDFLTSYVDGFSTTRELVTYQLFKDWMPEISLDSMATTIGDFESTLHQPDPDAVTFVQALDSWGPWLQLNNESTHRTLCGALFTSEESILFVDKPVVNTTSSTPSNRKSRR